MVQIVGKYTHVKSENLEEYYKTLGVPYVARKIMSNSNPTIQILQSEGGEWTIEFSTLFRTITVKFKVGEEYEEHMPGTVIKAVTTFEENKMITNCRGSDGMHTTRIYEFSDEGLLIVSKHGDYLLTPKLD